MSAGDSRLDPRTVFEKSIRSMTAFGYVDRGWIVSAYAAFYKRHAEKQKDKPEKAGLLARIGRGLSKLFGIDARKEPDRFAYLHQHKPGRDSLKILKDVLAHVPNAAPRAPGGRGATRRRALSEILEAADGDEVKLVAKFLRTSGLEETGFPVRLIGEKGDGSEPAAPASGASPGSGDGPARRSAALSTLTGGLLYRFAYDHDKKLHWEDTRKVFRASGLYRVYVVPADPAYVERRLLMVRLDEAGAIVRAAEIRKPRDRFVVRGGYVIPASGVNTFVLSSDFSPEVLAEMIAEEISPQARDHVFPGGAPSDGQTSASFLQEHQLGFYSLFSRGEGELRGAVLEAPTPATAVGYRINPAEVDLSAEALGVDPAEAGVRTPELGFLSIDEINERRDRILISAIGNNPAVSIDIG